MRVRNHWIVAVVAVAIALALIGAVAAITLFYQHMPDVPVSQNMIAHCDPTIADPPSVTLGSSGQVTFRCIGGSALSVVGSNINATPIVQSFRPPLTSLWVFNAGGATLTGVCSSRSDAVLLQNNTQVTLSPLDYNYCAEYANVGPAGIHSVTVQWTT